MPTRIGIMKGSDEEVILLEANLSTYLNLHITIDNQFTMMIQRKMRTSYLVIISPQEVVANIGETMKGKMVIFD